MSISAPHFGAIIKMVTVRGGTSEDRQKAGQKLDEANAWYMKTHYTLGSETVRIYFDDFTDLQSRGLQDGDEHEESNFKIGKNLAGTKSLNYHPSKNPNPRGSGVINLDA